MNKSRLVLPLAILLMSPIVTSCGPNKYEASFNNDQVICTHGSQIINVTLGTYVKGKMHFKDELTKEMFKMPEDPKYAGKTVEAAYSYNDGTSAYILLSGDMNAFTEESATLDIEVSKDAFKEDSLGGKISVSLFPNQIRYSGYLKRAVLEGNILDFEAVIETVGADLLCVGEYKYSGGFEYFNVTSTKGDVTGSATGGTINVYELEGDKYFIDAQINFSEIDESTSFTFEFKDGSTTLSGYKCAINPDASGPFNFVNA